MLGSYNRNAKAICFCFIFCADGLRTSRSHTHNGTTTTWKYVYNGSQLVQMKKGTDTLSFTYDASGAPTTVTHNGTVYYYVTNLQGDVVKIVSATGTVVATYTYDAWGNPISNTTATPSTLETLNPLRYRGYVYDAETELYYLQSRYYNPEIGRFLNADIFISTGQGILGHNMFAYCLNNPIMHTDFGGCNPLQIAMEFLKKWLLGDGTSKMYSDDSDIVKKLKASDKMKSLIDTAISNYENGKIMMAGNDEFTAEDDGMDLYLSTQHFNYVITIAEETRPSAFLDNRYTEKRYVATVMVYDKYNFDGRRKGLTVGNVLNNTAYRYNKAGGGNDYAWYAIYTYYTEWEKVY